MKNITPQEAEALLSADPQVQVLDVRTPREFRFRRLPNAVNIPVHELLSRHDELSREQEIIVLCEHGVRSASAARLLEGFGFTKVCNMLGGMSR
ncbi:MAG: rhodanese-like domain-containing protein, partial [Desulfobulbaceae bacterium]|nr:rhodanese-like domain-containing protein [Desulfobulbaceae bacterium]